jgi:hypothetical protein
MEHITITISAKTLNTIGAGLQEIPYKLAKPAVDEIDAQVRQYLAQKESHNERAPRGEVGDTDGDGNGPDRGYVEQD